MIMAVVKRKNVIIMVCIIVFSSGFSVAQDWPQWRGSNRDAKIKGFTIPDSWPKELTQKWKITVGEGTDSTPALVGDKLYVFTRQGGEEVTLCLNADTGKEIWKDSYEAPANLSADRGHAGPRSSPAVADGMIVTFGISGELSCLDATSGDLKWRKNDFPGDLPRFNTAMSPMIVDGLCIGEFGGQNNAAVVAYELSSGNQKWKWDSPGTTQSSSNLMTIGDMKIAVVMTSNNVVGINIADGSLLWEIPFEAGRNRQCVTPIVDGQKVICCGGQGQGMKAVEIKKEGDKFTVNDLWTYSDNYIEYDTPVIKNGFVFAVSNQDEYFCVNAENGQEAWINKPETALLDNISNSNVNTVFAAMRGGRGSSMGGGRGGRGGMGGRGGGMGSTAGYGTIVDAGSVLIGLIASGQLTVLEPNGKEYKELASYKVGDGPIYAYPVISGNRIYIKDQTSLTLWTVK